MRNVHFDLRLMVVVVMSVVHVNMRAQRANMDFLIIAVRVNVNAIGLEKRGYQE